MTSVYTRLGGNGVRQVDVRGLLAVAFTHRDSRDGDPDLHTHVAISNKVQTLDGRWRALDGRVLYKASVSASERYNTRLEAHLSARLGVRFAERTSGRAGKRPVREIVGMDPELLTLWSTRRRSIRARHADLSTDFVRRHGRQPGVGETHALYDLANTSTRRAKHAPRSRSEQRTAWWQQAGHLLGGDDAVVEMITGVSPRPTQPEHRVTPSGTRSVEALSPAVAGVAPTWPRDAADRAVAVVARSRATWQTHHVRAEIERIARTDTVPLEDLDLAVDSAVEVALSPAVSIRLGDDTDRIVEPAALRRRDGSSVFTVAGSQLFTSQKVIDAEARVLAAAGGGGWPAGLRRHRRAESARGGGPASYRSRRRSSSSCVIWRPPACGFSLRWLRPATARPPFFVDFAQQTTLPVCWFTLGPSEADPQVFLEYLVFAIQRRYPGFGRADFTLPGERRRQGSRGRGWRPDRRALRTDGWTAGLARSRTSCSTASQAPGAS